MSDDDLDDEQSRAVEAEEARIAVLAGPGSGKTRTLSHRAQHLLGQDAQTRALLLTFTNKAAAEMKARALATGVVGHSRIRASTFHGFGARMLRNHGELVGVSQDFDFLDDGDQQALAGEVALRLGIPERLRRWSYLRLRRMVAKESVLVFGEAFQEAKRDAGLVDYDDLVVFTADLLERYSEVAEVYGAGFNHVLVDEFQDTNAAQFAIVQALCPCVRTVSVFADDDQAIFRFAGAELENVKAFVDELEARVYHLTRNYRCREAIVKVANRLIGSDPQASGRQMEAVRGGGDVRVVRFQTMESEAEGLCTEISGRLDSGARPSDIAVLVRSGYRADALVHELRRRELPVSDWRGPIYEPRGRQTLATCMSVVRGALNDRQAERLTELLQLDHMDERSPQLILEANHGLAGVSDLMRVRELAFSGAPPSEIATAAHAALLGLDADHAKEIEPLVDAVRHFEAHDPDFSLDDFLAELALGGGGRPPTQGGGIKVASLHRTKGLQWPHVYLVGLEEGHLPDYRDDENPEEEERRLCFVGVCRAEASLTLTVISRFRSFAKTPSRFLSEMDLADLI